MNVAVTPIRVEVTQCQINFALSEEDRHWRDVQPIVVPVAVLDKYAEFNRDNLFVL